MKANKFKKIQSPACERIRIAHSHAVALNFFVILLLLSFVVNAAEVSHPAEQVKAGTFGAGDYLFPQDLTVNGHLTAGDYTLIKSDAELQKNNEVFLNLKNIQPGGKQWALISAGSPGGIGLGKFSIYDKTDGVSRLTIDTDGNVGIGTTKPNSPLEVAGIIHSTLNGFKFPDNTLQLTGVPSCADGEYIKFNGSTKKWKCIIGPSQSGNSGWTDDGSVVRLTTAADKVGIGTVSPSQKLDVIGQIHATGDICTDAGGGVCLSNAKGPITGGRWVAVDAYSETHPDEQVKPMGLVAVPSQENDESRGYKYRGTFFTCAQIPRPEPIYPSYFNKIGWQQVCVPGGNYGWATRSGISPWTSGAYVSDVYAIPDPKVPKEPTPTEEISCVKAACAQGAYDCRFSSNLNIVLTKCINVKGSCVTDACKAGSYDCRFSSNLNIVLTKCINVGEGCVKAACDQGAYDCRFSSNLNIVLTKCINVKGSCVTDACKAGGHNCRFSSNLNIVLMECINVE